MKRHGFTLIEAFSLVAVLIILAAILFPIFARQRDPRRDYCRSNLKQIGLGLKIYSQDYNEKFPPAAGGAGVGWADGLETYIKNTQVYQCSQDTHPTSTDPKASGYIDYWLNSRVAGVNESDFTSIANTILCGDGNDGRDKTDARYSYSMLPFQWLADPNSPLFRHLDGANYLFADGHVKLLKPEQVTTGTPDGGHYTFAVK